MWSTGGGFCPSTQTTTNHGLRFREELAETRLVTISIADCFKPQVTLACLSVCTTDCKAKSERIEVKYVRAVFSFAFCFF